LHVQDLYTLSLRDRQHNHAVNPCRAHCQRRYLATWCSNQVALNTRRKRNHLCLGIAGLFRLGGQAGLGTSLRERLWADLLAGNTLL